MAQSYIEPGHVIEMAAPSGGVTAGTPFLAGVKVFIPTATAAETVTVAVSTCGVHKVTKAGSQEWVVGAAVYWDDTNKVFTTSATNNTAAGYAAAYVGNGAGATTGYVMLNGQCG